MWYRKLGTKWHLGRCDGTYTAKCGEDLRAGVLEARKHMAKVAVCGHCWKIWVKGFDKENRQGQ